MNIDIKKGCFYRITTSFGIDEIDYCNIVAEGLNLEQMEDTLIEKIEENLYTVVCYARDKGQGTIVPTKVSIEPRYYYFIQKDGSNERYPVTRTQVSMYDGYKTKKNQVHISIFQ